MSSMQTTTTSRGINLSGNSKSNGVIGDLSSQSSPILDTLKKKMSQLKEDLETTKEEATQAATLYEEEKRRRECVRAGMLIS
jgi:outer membrane murein-binding lipoprotein Lpp